MDGKSDAVKLCASYVATFSGRDASAVLADLREYAKIDKPVGCISHEEYAYLAGMQDLVKYIEGMSTTKE
jgi:hypothetical protein